MKKQNSKFSTIRTSLYLLGSAFVLLTAQPALAGFKDVPSVRVERSQPINGQPVFQVKLDATSESTIRITDEEGRVLYSETISSGAYSKRFQVAHNGQEEVRLYVEVKTADGQKSQRYFVEGAADNSRLVVARY